MTFSLPVKQQRIWKCQAAETPICLSFMKVKMQSPKEIEVVTNLIATALYCDRTDLIPILTFSNTACGIQLHSRSTTYYLYFPNLNIHEMLNFLRVWVWCNERRSCYLLDLGLIWSAMKIGYKQLNQ